jgi:hypothetical protein
MAGKTERLVPIDTKTGEVTPEEILRLAVKQGANVEQLAKLLELQRSGRTERARQAYNEAMAKFKKKPPKILKNKRFKDEGLEYDYATLDRITETITQRLSSFGFTHRWKLSQSPEVIVTCVLTHLMGHAEESTLRADPDTSGNKNSIQAVCSTVTYLEKCTLLAVVGMAASGMDNDGRIIDGDPRPAVPDARVQEFLSSIGEAPDRVALQRIFLKAFQDAQTMGDKNAQAQYIRENDRRRRVLRANG